MITRGEALLIALGFALGGVVGPALLAGVAWALAAWLAIFGAIP